MPNNVIEIVPIVFNVEMGNRCLQKILEKANKTKKQQPSWLKTDLVISNKLFL